MWPELNNSSNTALIEYLCNLSINYNFTTSILRFLTEERCAVHHELTNLYIEFLKLQVGDMVKSHAQLQYKLEYWLSGKLIYSVQGAYIIINNIGHNSFEVQNWLGNTTSIQKYKAH